MKFEDIPELHDDANTTEWVTYLYECDTSNGAGAWNKVIHNHGAQTDHETEQVGSSTNGVWYKYECSCGEKLTVTVSSWNETGRLL